MPRCRTIDVHAHILSEETISLMRKEAPQIGPRLQPIDDDFAVLEVAGTAYRPFPRGGWDMSRRLADMDAAGVDVQVVSNTPQTFLYNQEGALAAALSIRPLRRLRWCSGTSLDAILGLSSCWCMAVASCPRAFQARLGGQSRAARATAGTAANPPR